MSKGEQPYAFDLIKRLSLQAGRSKNIRAFQSGCWPEILECRLLYLSEPRIVRASLITLARGHVACLCLSLADEGSGARLLNKRFGFVQFSPEHGPPTLGAAGHKQKAPNREERGFSLGERIPPMKKILQTHADCKNYHIIPFRLSETSSASCAVISDVS